MKQSLLLLLLGCSISLLFSQGSCALDPSFNTNGKIVELTSRLAEHMIVQADGKILVACNPFGNSAVYIKRYHQNGSVDMSFGTNGKSTLQVAEKRTSIQAMRMFNDTLYITGTTSTDIGGTNTYVYAAAMDLNGQLVNSFGVSGVRKFNAAPDLNYVNDLQIDRHGKIFLCGQARLTQLYVVKMNRNGVLDIHFDGDGVAYLDTQNNDHWFEANGLAIDKVGNVLVTGKKYRANNGATIPAFQQVIVARFLPNGALDPNFATGGVGLYNSSATNFDEGKAIHVTPMNEYIICGNTYDGHDYDYSTLKVRFDGSLQTTFGTNGWVLTDLSTNNQGDYSLNSALLHDGRILLTGNHGDGDTVYFSLLMLKADGSRDGSFAPNGVFTHIFDQNNNSSSAGLAISPDGKILLSGYTRTCVNGNCGALRMAVSRYTSNLTGVGIEEGRATKTQVYPNPVKDMLYIENEIPGTNTPFRLVGLQGKTMLTGHLSFGENRLFLQTLPSGIYYLQIEGQRNVKVVKR
jgi:uncharacterized delta-60 repeat protein